MVNLRCPVCAGALEKRAGAYLCPKNHSFDIAKSGYVNLLLNSSQGHHGDDKLMVRARRDFLDKGYYDRFLSQPQLLRVPTIGICYPCQLLAHVPVDSHDVRIGKVYCGLEP